MKLSTDDLSRLIEMAWEDRTPFEAILAQFNLSESEVKDIMRVHTWNQALMLCGASEYLGAKRNMSL